LNGDRTFGKKGVIMNSETGRIMTRLEVEALSDTEKAKCVPIDEQMMTLKQKLEMQVSPHDSKSELGKLRIRHKNSLRNQPCPCGSGYKFKKCCWSKVA